MNQLLQDAFNRAADLPPRNRTGSPDSCWPSLRLANSGTNYSTGRNRMSC